MCGVDTSQPQQPVQPLGQSIVQPQQATSSPVTLSAADPGKPVKPVDPSARATDLGSGLAQAFGSETQARRDSAPQSVGLRGTGVMAQVLKVFKVPKLGRKPSVPPQPISIGHPEMGPVNHAPIEAGPAMPAEIEIIPETPEVSAEVAEHVEAVERGEIQLPEPVVTPQAMPTPGAVPAVASIPNIILPVTRDDFQVGAKKPVSTSWRWLVEWVTWIIKKHPGRVLYRT